MNTSMRARIRAICIAAVLTASCSNQTGGTALPQHTSTATPPPAAAPPTTAVAPAPSAPGSDDDRIRQTLTAFQDSYNTQNWDAYLQQMCTAMRAKFTGSLMDYVKSGRAVSGVIAIKIISIAVTGDTAIATMEGHNETLGTHTVTMPLKLEGGWKICRL